MRKISIVGLLVFASIVLYTGCTYDKASVVYPSAGCDTANIRLSVELNRILAANCYSCHAGDAASGGGVTLENYNVLKAHVDNGDLLSAITQDGKVTPMPQVGNKLSDCEINKFKAWINAGAPNN